MGLDIRAYSKIRLIDTLDTTEAWEDKYYLAEPPGRDTFFVWPDYVLKPDFPEQLGGVLVAGGVCEYEKTFSFRDGSYFGYNVWREKLSLVAIGVVPMAVWNSPDKFYEKPFYYLINFSDCEGYIAGEPAKKLAKDFHEFRSIVEEHEFDWHFKDKYDKWRAAFDLAADNGTVAFR